MNKITKILITLSVILLIIFSGVYWYFNNHSELQINFNSLAGSKVYIYPSNNPKDKTILSAGEKLNLRNKDYTIKVTGDNIIEQTIDIPLKEDKEVYAPIMYGDKYLDQAYENEKENLYNLINTKYPQQMFDYEILYIKLSKSKDWAVGKLNSKTGGRNSDSYVFVAHKNNGNWEIAAGPALAVSSYEYPKIPKEVLQDTVNL